MKEEGRREIDEETRGRKEGKRAFVPKQSARRDILVFYAFLSSSPLMLLIKRMCGDRLIKNKLASLSPIFKRILLGIGRPIQSATQIFFFSPSQTRGQNNFILHFQFFALGDLFLSLFLFPSLSLLADAHHAQVLAGAGRAWCVWRHLPRAGARGASGCRIGRQRH